VLEQTLSQTFSALSDSTRRAMIARLVAEGVLSVSELAEPFAMSLPAVMKHLDCLATAGLVARSKQGRVVSYKLTPSPMGTAIHWLEQHQVFWAGSLDKLAARAASAKPRTVSKRKGIR
jgi:DNA-binding transcriptional ArsR family regulator